MIYVGRVSVIEERQITVLKNKKILKKKIKDINICYTIGDYYEKGRQIYKVS